VGDSPAALAGVGAAYAAYTLLLLLLTAASWRHSLLAEKDSLNNTAKGRPCLQTPRSY
jgi:hypothetical protein